MTRDVTSTVERAVESEMVFRRVNNDIEASASECGADTRRSSASATTRRCHAGIELVLDGVPVDPAPPHVLRRRRRA